MSFSSDIKLELSKLNNLKNKEEVKYEFVGYLITSNIDETKNFIKYSTENQYNINRLNKLLNNLFIDYDISMKGNVFVIKIKKEDISQIKEEVIEKIKKEETQENLKKSFLRGSFLGGGSINDPNKKYHMEIVLIDEEHAKILCDLAYNLGINFKKLERKNSYSLYIKEGEEISKFLAAISSSMGVIKFEEVRVIRDMRNNINRKVNCETANLNKTINAAVKQIDNIKYIYKKNKKILSDNLLEIAELRLENPDASLVELGQMMKEPIGKSGVNHRLKKINEIADELRNKK